MIIEVALEILFIRGDENPSIEDEDNSNAESSKKTQFRQ